ncbi:hypothetical protein Lal_00018081 [Lupinus albus]|nr:hypothetical protein Lal_00018081 [Lupinus albus]
MGVHMRIPGIISLIFLISVLLELSVVYSYTPAPPPNNNIAPPPSNDDDSATSPQQLRATINKII